MFKVEKHLSSANVPRTIRFTEELFEQLNVIAVKHDVSFNTLILECCVYAIDNMQEDGEGAK